MPPTITYDLSSATLRTSNVYTSALELNNIQHVTNTHTQSFSLMCIDHAHRSSNQRNNPESVNYDLSDAILNRKVYRVYATFILEIKYSNKLLILSS